MKRVIVVVIIWMIVHKALADDVVNYSWYGVHRESIKYDKYYTDLLKLALEKSESKFGHYELNKVDAGMSQNHMIELARNNRLVNLVWTMTSKDREEKLIPIRIPLLKGLGGCRVFLIRKGEQKLFNTLTNADELAHLYAGQGTTWPDTIILNHNNFQVSTAREHASLYQMLEKGRFDYFPRALHEAFNEIEQYPELAIEQRFALYYDSPFFFFVNKANPRLARRIQYGLELAIADGSFDEFFESNEITAGLIEKANLEAREVIFLDNPLLTVQTRRALNSSQLKAVCARKGEQ
ncbi:hypothetical protein tloyanaT_19270 [Thalassotalea loyana]|uniref:Solute-binding protein family 3/N-terminal domain-containing protein n=1 Tax=Thalassotalea loyana TaxID=280483 RepID=A0ABQ6HG08_9GAMM|nr:transporter substrate-binding domain-containing protein [Thalassotalea loyana]GLX85675.1 hypothetical protein tloyanaT_19270 [Thalassotalea loyana]